MTPDEMTTTGMGVGVEHVRELSRNERLCRNLLNLITSSAVGAPIPSEDLGLWLEGAFERERFLSDGEAIVFGTALAIFNGDAEARVADLARLDSKNRAAVAAVLNEWMSA